ncbi:hypothetical protein TUN205_03824, partial [Pyrenophora tritici-repentis]
SDADTACRRNVRRPSWQDLPGFSGDVTGSSTSLSLYSGPSAVLWNWDKHTNFNKLQHFAIRDCGLSGEEMEWIAQNNLLPNLKTLLINLNCNDDYNEQPRYIENVTSFFQSIDSLEELAINGPMEPQMIETVLIHHGPTLKKLSLTPSESTSNTRVRREKLPWSSLRIGLCRSRFCARYWKIS